MPTGKSAELQNLIVFFNVFKLTHEIVISNFSHIFIDIESYADRDTCKIGKLKVIFYTQTTDSDSSNIRVFSARLLRVAVQKMIEQNTK